MLTSSVFAQSMRLGPLDLFLRGTVEVAYDSNVDDSYPEEEKEDLNTGDFYWKPGLELRTQRVPFFRNSTFSLAAGIAYEDYFVRNDLDTELYDAQIDFNTILPRMTLGGMASTEYSVDATEDQYVPGGVSRDPKKINAANAFINWHHRKFRVETSANWSMERHDYEEYQIGDQDETTFFAGVYLDVYTWGSLVYSWEETVTDFVQTSNDTDVIVKDFGFQGAIPLTWLAHPKIFYSIGIQSTDDSSAAEKDGTWEPSHTLRAEDELKFGKTVTLSGYVEYNNKVYDDDIGFTYFIRLEQLLGPRAVHALSFNQEPRDVFGSTVESETTTYAYDFKINDLFIYNLSFRADVSYNVDTPLGEVENRRSEETTTLMLGLDHTRQISRQLSRVLAYEYSWEDSNFHNDGAKEKHLLTYGFSYDF